MLNVPSVQCNSISETMHRARRYYRCRLVAPEQFFEYPLSIFRACDRVSDGPLVSEDLIVITPLYSGQRTGRYETK